MGCSNSLVPAYHGYSAPCGRNGFAVVISNFLVARGIGTMGIRGVGASFGCSSRGPILLRFVLGWGLRRGGW